MDAGLRLRRLKDELSLAAFLLDRIVAGNRDLPERLPVFSYAIAEHDIVHSVCERRYAERR